MARKIYDLAVKTGSYQDRTTGQDKGRWQNVGAVMEADDGSQFIMLAKWFNPAGVPDLSGRGATSESILVSCFAPNTNAQQQAPQQRQPQQQNNAANPQRPQNPPPASMDSFDDDIPF